VKQLANKVIAGLRDQPFMLALLVINLVFLISLMLVFREIASTVERKDALVVQLLQQCAK
jgi:hypothetical protein